MTFPSHMAAVLPLKLWRPGWCDGVALATGTVAPDVRYLAMGILPELPETHTLTGLLWWCLPVALAYAWIIRRSIGRIAAHLPLPWRAYGALGQVRHPFWITVSSALVGAITHVGWDWFTHTDWLRDYFGVDWYAATGTHWWTVFDLTSTVVGGVVAITLGVRIARQPDLLDQSRQPVSPARPRAFWAATGTTAAVGLAVLPFLPGAHLLATTVVRLLHLIAVALLAGVLAAARPAIRIGS